jgi:polyferredoxin
VVEKLARGIGGTETAPNRLRVRSGLALPRLRRLSQITFLLLFVIHVCATAYRGSLPAGGAETRLPFSVRLLLDFDPLAAVSNALATRALYQGLLWSLAILLPTFFFGRFFCGWICPLGTLHHFFSHLKSESKLGRRRIESNRYRRWQTLKYYLLLALLAAAFFGGALVGILDPLVLFVRTLTASILPALNYALAALLRISVFSFRQPYFRQGFLLGLLFVTILALNLRITRFWCRALCPLGALLGLVSRWSILGIEKRAVECGECNRCLLHCQGGDDPLPGAPWRKAECHLCLNCVADCPEGALRFRLFPPRAATRETPDLKRRRVLTSLAAGTAALPLLRANTGLAVETNPRLIRPPAALAEKDFLARCIRCGECLKVCPSNALHPAFSEAGWEGIWTPVLVPRVGFCQPNCTLCGQVCPTGAIWEFTSGEKGWAAETKAAKPIRIGTAFYDRGRCLPWAMAIECIVCEEWCPVSPKAIYLRPAEVFDAAGNAKQVHQPYLDPERCVGCGACEFACPVRDRPAISISSVGESRSATNQLLLRKPLQREVYLPESNAAPGWIKTADTRTFVAADLWKYVDGDADRYLHAGVRQTFTAGYRYRNGLEAVADVHQMADRKGATALYESESAAGSHVVSVGDSGRSYGQSLTFRKGCFFVRLVAFDNSPGVESALLALARAVAQNLGTDGTFPESEILETFRLSPGFGLLAGASDAQIKVSK